VEGRRVCEEGGVGKEGTVVDNRVGHEMEELCKAKTVRCGGEMLGQDLLLLRHEGSLNDNEQHAPGDPAMALFQGPIHVSNASIRLLILHAVQLAFLAFHTKIPV
jgi:hypothetical protein